MTTPAAATPCCCRRAASSGLYCNAQRTASSSDNTEGPLTLPSPPAGGEGRVRGGPPTGGGATSAAATPIAAQSSQQIEPKHPRARTERSARITSMVPPSLSWRPAPDSAFTDFAESALLLGIGVSCRGD